MQYQKLPGNQDVVSFPDARETGHNTTETNLYDTEAKVNQQYSDKA